MLPGIHFMTSAIMAASLFPGFGWKVMFVIFAGFLLDADHYILFLIKEKSFNLVKAYNYFRYGNCSIILKNDVLVFHTIEVLVVLAVLSLYSEIFLMIILGVLLHIILDVIYDIMLYRDVKMPSLLFWLFHKFYKSH